MKWWVIYSILSVLTVLGSCQGSTNIEMEEKNPELVVLDSFFFRRAYHGHDTMSGNELDRFMNRNPEGAEDYSDDSPPFYENLVKHGLVQDGNLNLSEIDTLPEKFEYAISSNRKLHVEYNLLEDPNEVEVPSYEVSFKEKGEVILIDTLAFGFPPDVTFFTRDLDNDGTEELLAVFRWYIINGDNYELFIYQLREESPEP